MAIDWLFVVVIFIAFLAVLLAPRIRVSTAVVELILGIILATIFVLFGISWLDQGHEWLKFLGGLGALMITFLAGASLKVKEREKLPWKLAMPISILSFVLPFVAGFLASFYLLNWGLLASILVGVAIAETSVAITYVVLVEANMTQTVIGKLILTITFVTNLLAVIALTLLLGYPNIFNPYVIALLVLLIASWWFMPKVKFMGRILGKDSLTTPREGRLGQREVMVAILLLTAFGLFAEFGAVAAVLPAYILGFILGPTLHEKGRETLGLKRIRTVTFALLSPIFFIGAGMRTSYKIILSSFLVISLLVLIKVIAKYVPARLILNKLVRGKKSEIKKRRKEVNYASWLLCTGLTWGTITAVLGFDAGILSQIQFSILETVIIISAVIPSVIAEKFFRPR